MLKLKKDNDLFDILIDAYQIKIQNLLIIFKIVKFNLHTLLTLTLINFSVSLCFHLLFHHLPFYLLPLHYFLRFYLLLSILIICYLRLVFCPPLSTLVIRCPLLVCYLPHLSALILHFPLFLDFVVPIMDLEASSFILNLFLL